MYRLHYCAHGLCKSAERNMALCTRWRLRLDYVTCGLKGLSVHRYKFPDPM